MFEQTSTPIQVGNVKGKIETKEMGSPESWIREDENINRRIALNKSEKEIKGLK